MFMNRWLSRAEIVELNNLDADEESLVFARLGVHRKSGAVDCFLEQDADRVIGLVRRRPPQADRPSFCVEAEDVEVIEQAVGAKNAWAASVDQRIEKPSKKLPAILLVDEKQAAQMLGVSRRMIFDLNKQGTLPSVKVGARKKYSVKMLRSFADGGEV